VAPDPWLPDLLDRSASRTPDHVAIEEPGAPPGTPDRITYGELARLSDQVRDRLCALGVRAGDRVGIYLRKSIDAVAAILGALKAGAAYVPVDPGAPASRNALILGDCSVRAVVIERRFAADFQVQSAKLGATPAVPLLLDGTGGGDRLRRALAARAAAAPAPDGALRPADALAYILYTSGSTGTPKGVMLTHRNALSFLDWCSDTFGPSAHDRFSSHAPFHFDLSILDLYLPLRHGATLILIPEEVGRDPGRLAPLIADRRLSVWYSAPSILSLLVQYGKLQHFDCSSLRLVLFAGEVFPVRYLRDLQGLLPASRYVNLYGPTETNVCTFYEIPRRIPAERTEPFPIGKACGHAMTRVVAPDGRDVPAGHEGELCVTGPGVMLGYWNLPEETARAFLGDEAGQRWYRTGDVVIEEADGNYRFLGRRDRMVKRRGYRVELGEIEAALYRHPAVKEAAVVALSDEQAGVRIKAFLSCSEAARPSLVELKRFCAEALPLYMVPDVFSFLDALPKTSTDKVDYQGLKELG
jgi:amino acid adenylation domain-containing protein